jgi:hypothetical protein
MSLRSQTRMIVHAGSLTHALPVPKAFGKQSRSLIYGLWFSKLYIVRAGTSTLKQVGSSKL